MKNQLFSQKEVNKIFEHIPVKTLRDWGLKELYGWVDEFTDRRGTHREYTLVNLYQIGVVEKLNLLNVPASTIKRVMSRHFFVRGDQPQQIDVWENPITSKDQVLVIHPVEKRIKKGKSKEPRVSWESFKTHKEHLVLGITQRKCYGMVVINLTEIKEYVDSLIRST